MLEAETLSVHSPRDVFSISDKPKFGSIWFTDLLKVLLLCSVNKRCHNEYLGWKVKLLPSYSISKFIFLLGGSGKNIKDMITNTWVGKSNY